MLPSTLGFVTPTEIFLDTLGMLRKKKLFVIPKSDFSFLNSKSQSVGVTIGRSKLAYDDLLEECVWRVEGVLQGDEHEPEDKLCSQPHSKHKQNITGTTGGVAENVLSHP